MYRSPEWSPSCLSGVAPPQCATCVPTVGRERLACIEKLFTCDSAFSHSSKLFFNLYSSFVNITGCKMSSSPRLTVGEPQFLFHGVVDTEPIADFHEAVRNRETTTPKKQSDAHGVEPCFESLMSSIETTSSPSRLGKSDQPYPSPGIGRTRRWHLISHPAEPGSPTIMVSLGVKSSRIRFPGKLPNPFFSFSSRNPDSTIITIT